MFMAWALFSLFVDTSLSGYNEVTHEWPASMGGGQGPGLMPLWGEEIEEHQPIFVLALPTADADCAIIPILHTRKWRLTEAGS